jgi:S-adenosylmethionine:tRNA ribosyltransferase-isomerase
VPAGRRDESRLLVLKGAIGRQSSVDRNDIASLLTTDDRRPTTHLTFTDFPSLLNPADLLVVNDSRVIPARLLPARPGGGAAEVLLVRKEAGGVWRALVKPGGRIKAGKALTFPNGDRIEILEHLDTGERRVRLVGEGGEDGVLARHGHIPLPPYIQREDTAQDRERYQTVYAREPGSVAAPTAGLHFTREILAKIEARGAKIAAVTLHVGPGTFRPVATDDPDQHRMDEEWYRVPGETADAIRATRERGGAVWAVGTTALRTLESAGRDDGTVTPGEASTTLFIRPGYRFKVVDRLLTNFHLPRSTLLMLVCAFAGTERTLAAYREAVARRYRFYSYGDAMAVI